MASATTAAGTHASPDGARMGANQTLRFVVPGIAQTKGSAKSFGFVPKDKLTGRPILNRSGKPMIRTVTTNDNPKSKSWQQTIAEHASKALASSNLQPFPDGPVIVDAWFYFPRPQKYLTKKFAHVDVPHVTKPDGDKALRLVCDSLSGLVYPDDSRVIDAYAHKRYCRHGEIPRVEITVRAVSFELPTPIHHPDAPTLFGEETLYS